MYVPQHFALDDLPAIHAIIRENSFATLVSTRSGEMVASHLPFMVSEGGPAGFGVLRAHMARANAHWQQFDGETEALVIFEGVHGYISPDWYARGKAVPTWDYIAVHAYGTPRIIEDEAAVVAMLHELVHVYEDGRETPWRSEDQEASYIAGMAKGIVAFEILISRLEGKAKLGQNRPTDQPSVVAALANSQSNLAAAIRTANGL